MKKVILIHGWGGHAEIHWLPAVKKELEAKGFEVVSLNMPDADNPDQVEWVTEISRAVGAPSKDLYFITHSLGGIALLRYLETLSDNQCIGGAVLVCGFTEPIGYIEPDSFLQTPVDYEKIKKVGGAIIALNSDNDTYVSVHHAKVLRDKLGAELIMLSGAGHINTDSGYTELPQVIQALLKIAV